MNQEKEFERHSRILEQIKNASSKEELPDITPSTFSTFLATNVYFDNNHVSSSEFSDIFQAVLDYGFFVSPEVKDKFIEVLRKNYPENSEEEYLNKYIEISKHPRINYIIIEILERNKKILELNNKQELLKHENVMKQIRNAYEENDLPKVSRSHIARCISDNSKTEYNDKINVKKLYDLIDLLIEGYSIKDDKVSEELLVICKSENIECANEMHDQIVGQLLNNNRLNYLVEEVKEKEQRTGWIYKNDHEEVMNNIKDARRISQLPPNMSLSKLTGYLSGNSIIYPKGNKIPSGAFENTAKLLMDGKKFEDREIIDELARIVIDYYPEKLEEAFMLLIDKLSSLPKIYYYAEEVRESLKKQKIFIDRGGSNVNVYFVPNPKSPLDAGKFYNVYISRAQNLDLEDILPLKLEDIVPPEMDVDSIEWYVQEYYDETFKTAGGIILNKDESIGNVNIFQPSDGKIGITPEEQSRYQELEDVTEKMKRVIAKKKEGTSEFAKRYDEFLKAQQAIDEELAQLEEKLNFLTQEKKNRGGRR